MEGDFLLYLVYALYGLCLVLGVIWAVSKWVVHRRQEKEDDTRLFDLMGKDDFKVYVERLRQEHEAAKAIAAQEVDDSQSGGEAPDAAKEDSPSNAGDKK